jgi:hypothetical protein
VKDSLVPQPQPELIPSRLWNEAGRAADAAAARNVFQRYQRRKAQNTLRRQAGDLAIFAEFLRSTAIPHNLLWTILWDGIPDVLEMSKLTIGQ